MRSQVVLQRSVERIFVHRVAEFIELIFMVL